MISKELNDILSATDFESGGIQITGADWGLEDARIQFAINTGVEGESQRWEIQIKGVREDLIKSDVADKLELFDEHPLLWTYTQRQCNLYFGSPTERPDELFVNIYNIHRKLTRNRTPFDRYINKALYEIDLCKSASGLFARGPIKIMEAYQQELARHQMRPTMVGEYNPKRWLNGYQVDETEIVKVLVIGDLYIIGEAFDFKKL
ncbi:MAG: hypothetical protein U0289_06145 [Cyclobacteriaceae bacterium]|nr:hypothetical protein [Cyclobacteriaceae bacterium]